MQRLDFEGQLQRAAAREAELTAAVTKHEQALRDATAAHESALAACRAEASEAVMAHEAALAACKAGAQAALAACRVEASERASERARAAAGNEAASNAEEARRYPHRKKGSNFGLQRTCAPTHLLAIYVELLSRVE